MFDKAIQDALILWATIDPIGTLAIFSALTAGMSVTQRRKTATRAVLYAGGVLIGSLVIGQVLLTAMGISLLSFQLGGGIILFLFGLQMIFTENDQSSGKEPDHNVAIFPIAIPATATPGAILAVILLTDNQIYPIAQQLMTGLIVVATLAITWVMMFFSDRILAVIGSGGASLLTKIMGMILAALSVQLVMNAIGVEQWANIGP
ncbi:MULTISPECIES: MarC family protein [Thalassolituus]|uniref:MarC family protein n=1 Tax=Thalassolituus TaxID=187492 RepID=UPI000C0EF02B|nr:MULTISPECIES: MarC family protein [Thalassolituus]MAX85606.1 chemotaxis protein CheR [Oceanospirillaceae bacterium]MBN56844.1 chemotaxis protein CheR [Oceanospirillaceae bacterium]|tara:strand:- start:1028 stop:1642 length:615 start_codon:yes stop_codon:yes gene_type:complete